MVGLTEKVIGSLEEALEHVVEAERGRFNAAQMTGVYSKRGLSACVQPAPPRPLFFHKRIGASSAPASHAHAVLTSRGRSMVALFAVVVHAAALPFRRA